MHQQPVSQRNATCKSVLFKMLWDDVYDHKDKQVKFMDLGGGEEQREINILPMTVL